MRSTDVWDLPNIDEWRDSFIEMIENIHPYSDLCCKLTMPHRDTLQDDDVNILNSIISDFKGHECDFIELLVYEFRRKYSFVRAAHASRLTDVEIILIKGLSVFTIENYYQMAKAIFLSDCYPLIAAEDVHRAVDEIGREGCGRVGKLYFSLTEFNKQCSHYFEHGSEFMLAVANNLGVKDRYIENVKRKGMSVKFLCNVPVGSISDKLICACLRVAVYFLFEFKSSAKNLTSLKTTDVSIFIECGLNPSNIVSHHSFP